MTPSRKKWSKSWYIVPPGGSVIHVMLGVFLVLYLYTGSVVVAGNKGYQPDSFPDHEPIEADTFDASGAMRGLNASTFEAPEQMRPDLPIDGRYLRSHEVPFALRQDGSVAATGRASDGRVEVALPEEANEVYALVRAEVPKRTLIHQGKNPMNLWRLVEPSFFVFRVVYADGTHDGIIPYNLEIEDYGLFPGTQVCVLPVAEEKTPVRLVLEDRMGNSRFGVLAVTVNKAKPRKPFPKKVTTLPPEKTAGGGPGKLSAQFETDSGLRWADFETSGIGGDITAKGPVFTLVAGGERYDSTEWTVVESGTGSDENEIRLELRRNGLDLSATLDVKSIADRVRLNLEVSNHGDEAVDNLDNKIRFPVLNGLKVGSAEDTWYFFTAGGGMISDREVDWTDDTDRGDKEVWEYSDKKPFPFDGFFNPERGGGMTIYTEEDTLRPKKYELTKNNSTGAGYAVVYRYMTLGADDSWQSPPTYLRACKGGWRAQFRQLKSRVERPENAYGNNRFSSVFFIATPPIWTGNFRKDILRNADRYFGVRHVHLFGWSFEPHDDPTPREKNNEPKPSWKWKKWGYYGNFSKFGGSEEFKQDVVDYIRNTYRAGISYYTDPYLYDPDWDGVLERYYHSLTADRREEVTRRYNQQFDASTDTMNENRLIELWAARDRNGEIKRGYDSVQLCLGQPGLREYMLEQIRLTVQNIDAPTAIYLDEFNRLTNVCLARRHNHEPGAFLAPAREFIQRARKLVPDSIALFTEYTPPACIGRYQQGALGHVPDLAWSKWPGAVRSTYAEAAPHFVDLPRFVMPWLKLFDIHKNRVLKDGNWFIYRYAFFNGSGFFGRGFGGKFSGGNVEPAAVDFISNCLRVQRAHDHVFSGNDVTPLVSTEQELVFANRFRQNGSTVWTLYNAGYRTRRGVMLKVPHEEGAVYYDAWHNDRPLNPEVRDGQAYLETELGPRGVGCVVQRRR